MADTDQVIHIANEASVSLRNLAFMLREGIDPQIAADQADSHADMLMEALIDAQNDNPA